MLLYFFSVQFYALRCRGPRAKKLQFKIKSKAGTGRGPAVCWIDQRSPWSAERWNAGLLESPGISKPGKSCYCFL